MPLLSMQNYVAVAPRGSVVPKPEEARSGYAWQQTEDHIQHAEQRIFDSIEIARKKLHVSSQRVFLAGFDCGGTMAFRVALSHPHRFAGMLSLCGQFPSEGTPLSNLVGIRRLPVFLAVGRDSTEYSPDDACKDLRLMHSAGMSITLRQYPHGHELAPQMLIDVNRWVIEQVTSPSDCSSPSDTRRSSLPE